MFNGWGVFLWEKSCCSVHKVEALLVVNVDGGV